jgi:DNA-binding NarL/FixJ family response regulator
VPHSKIIILTAFENDEYVVGTLSSGVYAYLLKNTSDETVVQTVRRVYQGERLLTPSLMDKVLRQFETLAKSHAHREHDLGDDELAVLALIAEGASIQEIGAKVYCSERTVKRRIEGIVTKLGVRNRSQAVAHAIKSGLI